jgi:hypothetical protein
LVSTAISIVNVLSWPINLRISSVPELLVPFPFAAIST